MTELPFAIKKAVRKYENIEVDGLVFSPILVREYDIFQLVKPAIEVMHQSLPVALLGMPLLQALYQLDYDANLNGGQPSGLFSRSVLALALSLRLGNGETVEQRLRRFEIVVDRKNPQKLLCLRFTDNDGALRELKPGQYGKIRQIIAAQNGVRLESDLANPDIVRAKKAMASANAPMLDASVKDLISSISALCGVDEAEIEDWPILKLENRANSYHRIMDYIICGFAAANGTTWKNGNPNPHPYFDRVANSGLFTEIGSRDSGTKTAPPSAAQELQNLTKNL